MKTAGPSCSGGSVEEKSSEEDGDGAEKRLKPDFFYQFSNIPEQPFPTFELEKMKPKCAPLGRPLLRATFWDQSALSHEHDVILVFGNAMLFNASNTIYYRRAHTLKELALKLWKT